MYRHARPGLLALASILLSLQGCSDAAPTSIRPDPPTLYAASPNDTTIDRLSLGLARALASPAIRRQILGDMRDSPFYRNALHLKSYFKGKRGRAIVTAAAAGAHMQPEQFLGLLESLPDMEISMLLPTDRVAWAGTNDLVVFGANVQRRQLGRFREVTGYTLRGEEMRLHTLAASKAPVIAILRSEAVFGPDPEARHAASPQRSRDRISTKQDEWVTLTSSCDPNTAIIECNQGPGPGQQTPEGYQLSSQYTWANCTNVSLGNADRDGLWDGCEYELAHRFRPAEISHPFDEAPLHEPFFSARVGYEAGVIGIFYGFAYHRDPGEPHTGTHQYAHPGDAEFVIVFVKEYAPGYWKTESAILSAHWLEIADGTASYSSGQLEYADNYRGRPRIWIAKNKHANYPTRSACSSGGWWADTCDGNEHRGDVTFSPDRNIGNYYAPGATIRLRDELTSLYGLPGVERIWTGMYFTGWQGTSSGADGYFRSLDHFNF
ncbi:MAG TPA: hypothetical protein VHG28_09415 [Longimicrobiaceae bacterium]|nr:hypothetical protein [Longimicrobiaceae bacterium]